MTKRIAQFLYTSLFALAAITPAYAADINREWVDFTPPNEIKWVKNPAGTNESAILFGDPAKPGPYVIRRAKGIHYDGAKDQETIIQVWGMGPATSTPAEKK